MIIGVVVSKESGEIDDGIVACNGDDGRFIFREGKSVFSVSIFNSAKGVCTRPMFKFTLSTFTLGKTISTLAEGSTFTLGDDDDDVAFTLVEGTTLTLFALSSTIILSDISDIGTEPIATFVKGLRLIPSVSCLIFSISLLSVSRLSASIFSISLLSVSLDSVDVATQTSMAVDGKEGELRTTNTNISITNTTNTTNTTNINTTNTTPNINRCRGRGHISVDRRKGRDQRMGL